MKVNFTKIVLLQVDVRQVDMTEPVKLCMRRIKVIFAKAVLLPAVVHQVLMKQAVTMFQFASV